MSDVFGLGIESSCDETSIALVKNGCEILANPLFSQVELHRPYGGVIPEKASRAHLEKFPYLIAEILPQLKEYKISYVAVTVKPGLVGSLLVGYNTALALSWLLKAPFIGVHHLEAHLYAPLLAGQKLTYPFLGLLLSGGNSALYWVEDIGKISPLCDTLDDACGEAFDKASSLLGFPYPGGPHLEKEANLFMNSKNIEIGSSSEETYSKKNPLPKITATKEGKPVFSFSGIKTALWYFLQKKPNYSKMEVAYFFLQRCTEHILEIVSYYVKNYPKRDLVFAGGVARNQYIRKHLGKLAEKNKISLIIPPPYLCTDNGAMIAALGYEYFIRNKLVYVKKIETDNSFVFSIGSEFLPIL